MPAPRIADLFGPDDDAIIARAMKIMQDRMTYQARKHLSSPAACKDYLTLAMGDKEHEVFTVLFLDARNSLIAAEEMFRGTLTQTSVYPREVVKSALKHNAAACILAHNHPSGNPEPSQADRLLTRTLKDALAMVDVQTLDHIIVAGAQTRSFAEHGLM